MTPADLADFEQRIRRSAAERLVACALALQGEEMRRLSRPNPYPYTDPARKGEYPKARTFNLRNGIWVDPLKLDKVAEQLRIRVGYTARAYYGAILQAKGWKGLLDTLDTIRPQLERLLASFGSIRRA